MNVKKYTESCLNFAKDTHNWLGLDEYKHYVTSCPTETYRDDFGHDVTVQGWCESCDNAEDGINVRWAFHKSESYIREHAPQEFVDKLLEAIQVAIDDEWDEESLCGIINTFS